jgi:hypothetical protein
MKARLLLLSLALAALTTATFRVSAGTSFGGGDCGQWFNKTGRLNAKIWLSGYLSGLNSAIGKQFGDPLIKLSSMEQAFLWTDNYCKANPLSTLPEAGNALYMELRGKKQ